VKNVSEGQEQAIKEEKMQETEAARIPVFMVRPAHGYPFENRCYTDTQDSLVKDMSGTKSNLGRLPKLYPHSCIFCLQDVRSLG
jgi:hypothetical protein